MSDRRLSPALCAIALFSLIGCANSEEIDYASKIASIESEIQELMNPGLEFNEYEKDDTTGAFKPRIVHAERVRNGDQCVFMVNDLLLGKSIKYIVPVRSSTVKNIPVVVEIVDEVPVSNPANVFTVHIYPGAYDNSCRDPGWHHCDDTGPTDVSIGFYWNLTSETKYRCMFIIGALYPGKEKFVTGTQWLDIPFLRRNVAKIEVLRQELIDIKSKMNNEPRQK